MFFMVCFGVGIGYSIISFLLGEVISAFDFDADINLFGGLVSPLRPSVIAAFITVFGGAGLIFYSRVGVFITLGISIVFGFIISFLMYRFIIIPLYRAENTSAMEKQGFIGFDAKVTERIPQGRYGKITYYANGNTYSAPAKSQDGSEIMREELVVIVSIYKNTYFVEKVDKAKKYSDLQN